MEPAKRKTNRPIIYRKRMGFSQKDVAQLLGLKDTATLCQYERGHSLPPLTVALSLELILRVPVAFLFPCLYEELRAGIRTMEELAAGGQGLLF
mgnify:CR=1 FL=1